MKLKVGIFASMAMFAIAFGVYAAQVEAPPVPAQGAREEVAAPTAEGAVLPWEDPFLQLTSADDHVPAEPQIVPKVWCCKPDGNCGKIKQTKCARLGGVQHPTEAACYNDPNC